MGGVDSIVIVSSLERYFVSKYKKWRQAGVLMQRNISLRFIFPGIHILFLAFLYCKISMVSVKFDPHQTL